MDGELGDGGLNAPSDFRSPNKPAKEEKKLKEKFSDFF